MRREYETWSGFRRRLISQLILSTGVGLGRMLLRRNIIKGLGTPALGPLLLSQLYSERQTSSCLNLCQPSFSEQSLQHRQYEALNRRHRSYERLGWQRCRRRCTSVLGVQVQGLLRRLHRHQVGD